MNSVSYVRRLSDLEALKVASGEMRGQIETGEFLENPSLWNDSHNGKPVKSLMGKVGARTYSWPACGCGVRVRVRAVPL